jgi:hypothetical protein
MPKIIKSQEKMSQDITYQDRTSQLKNIPDPKRPSQAQNISSIERLKIQNVPALQHPKPQEVPSLKTSQIQNIPSLKHPKYPALGDHIFEWNKNQKCTLDVKDRYGWTLGSGPWCFHHSDWRQTGPKNWRIFLVKESRVCYIAVSVQKQLLQEMSNNRFSLHNF